MTALVKTLKMLSRPAETERSFFSRILGSTLKKKASLLMLKATRYLVCYINFQGCFKQKNERKKSQGNIVYGKVLSLVFVFQMINQCTHS